MKLAIFAVLASVASAFVAPNKAPACTQLNAVEDSRREFFSKAAVVGGAFVAGVAPANAIRDYENIAYLGGSTTVDLNNANVRAYLKMPGMYPTIAGKLASNGPYKAVGEIYSIPGLSEKEKSTLKKYESRFTALTPSADYVIDRINNGLYR